MNSRGIVLIISYMVVAVLSVLGSAFLVSSVSEKQSSESHSNLVRAFWLGEAGLQQGSFAFRNNDWEGWADIDASTKSLSSSLGSSGNYVVTVSGIGSNNITIASTGYSPDAVSAGHVNRTVVESYVSSSLFSSSAFGKSRVSLTGNARTDSYNSSLGSYGGANRGSRGDVITSADTAGAVTLTGSSRINGNAQTAPGGTVSLGPASRVTGSITHTNNTSPGNVSVPAGLSGLTSDTGINLSGSTNQTLPPGNYRLPAINISGNARLTLSGDVNIYLTGSSALNITGSGRLVVSGNANIYIDGTANISGAGVVNNTQIPQNFTLYGTASSSSITVAGSGVFYGGIYAPNAAISVTGNGGLYGAVVGDTITVTGSSAIHYDEAFSASASGGGYNLESWQEVVG